MMTIYVQGCNDGHNGRLRARRWFSNSEATKLTVLDQDDDPPDLDRIVDGKVIGQRPDPHSIGRRSFRELKADICIRILADTESQVGAAHEALESARKLAAEKAGALTEAELKLEAVTKDNERLSAEVSDLEGEVTSLRKTLEDNASASAKMLGDYKLEISMLTEENARLVKAATAEASPPAEQKTDAKGEKKKS